MEEEERSDCVEETVAKLPDHDYLAMPPSGESQLDVAQARIKELQDQLDKQRRPETHFLERYGNNLEKIKFYTEFLAIAYS